MLDVSDLPSLYLLDLFLLTSGTGLSLGVISIIVLLFLSGLISGSEVAFFSLTANDYEEIESKENPTNRLILSFRDQPRNLLATILIANNFINIAIVLMSTLLLESLFPKGIFMGWLETLQENYEWTQIISAELAA
ncbi:MAG: putative hemolysin, partial [Paraglaciecola sp.]